MRGGAKTRRSDLRSPTYGVTSLSRPQLRILPRVRLRECPPDIREGSGSPLSRARLDGTAVQWAARSLALAFFVWATLVAAQTVTVRHVIDGDSLVLSDGRQVRLIGINAPELGVDGRADQPLARKARERAVQLAAGQSVTLKFDRERTDRHGRALAYVALADGTDIQAQLVHEGLAWCVAIPPNTARVDKYCGAERGARTAKRGVWAEPSYVPTRAADLRLTDTGFRLVQGTVLRIGHSRHAVYLDLHPGFSIVIPNEAWREFPAKTKPVRGQTLVARGWVTEYKNRLRMRIAHPAMLEVLP